MLSEFDILQLERLGVFFELLGNVTLLEAIDLEEMELIEEENEKENKKENEKEVSDCRSVELRVSARELQLIGRAILAAAISKNFELQSCTIKSIKDLRKLQATHKIVIGEWIVVLGTILTLIGDKEIADICNTGEEDE